VSIPFAWLVGGVIQAAGVPLFGVARRAERAQPAQPVAEPEGEPGLEVESAGCFGPEPAATCVPRDDPTEPGERVA
jgi:hypothetical protein